MPCISDEYMEQAYVQEKKKGYDSILTGCHDTPAQIRTGVAGSKVLHD